MKITENHENLRKITKNNEKSQKKHEKTKKAWGPVGPNLRPNVGQICGTKSHENIQKKRRHEKSRTRFKRYIVDFWALPGGRHEKSRKVTESHGESRKVTESHGKSCHGKSWKITESQKIKENH